MLIRGENIEKRLLTDLKDLWGETSSFRCVYLRFSLLELDLETWFPCLRETLETVLNDAIENIYICADNDIFVTSRSITQRQVTTFLTHLKPKLPPVSLEGLASIFELKVDWPKIRHICEHKIETLETKAYLEQQKNKKDKNEEVEHVTRAQTLETLDQDLVSSLSMRRDMRKEAIIMVVEDDPFTQKLLKNTIGAKYNLCLSKDGQGAIMSYIIKAPDILFLDIGLPDMDGHKVLEKIFKIDPKAHVVMFSGNGDRNNILKAVELGAKGFIGKPFTKTKLFQYIDSSPYMREKTCH